MNRLPKNLRLNVFHLEDEKDDQATFRAVFRSEIAPRIVRFFRESFSVACVPKLYQAASIAELSDMLLEWENARPSLTTEAQDCGLFVLDYFVKPDEQGRARALANIMVRNGATDEDMSFLDWIRTYFPAVPAMFLTSGDHTTVPPGWDYEPKDRLNNPAAFGTAFWHRAQQWWEPTFSNKLDEYAEDTGADSWHTPGHNAGNAFLLSPLQRPFYQTFGSRIFRTDLSVSVDRLGDLSEPDHPSPLSVSLRRSAAIFGSRDTFYVTNGTSTSNKALLQALMRPGDVVVIDRNCHKSVHQAVVMAGVLPLYLSPAFNRTLGVWSPLSDTLIREVIDANFPEELRPRMLVITSCTYEGVLYPIGQLARLCERREMLLVADEAWAPHLRFHPFYTGSDSRHERFNATDAGAHFCVQSTHKALAAFSQASMIHVSKRFEELLESPSTWRWLRSRFEFAGGGYSRFRHQLFETLRYWHSTSPHYPMLATLDRASVQMRLEGLRLLNERLNWAARFASVPSVAQLVDIVGDHRRAKYSAYLKDPLKLVIAASPEGVTALKKALAEQYVTWEKSAAGCVEFLITIGTTEANVESLLRALSQRSVRKVLERPEISERSFDYGITAGQVEVLPRIAAAAEGELRSLEEMETAETLPICAQMVTPYPPGIPVMLPGLRITKAMIASVREVAGKGGEVHGLHDGTDGRQYVHVMKQSEEEAAIATDASLAKFQQWLSQADIPATLIRGDQ